MNWEKILLSEIENLKDGNNEINKIWLIRHNNNQLSKIIIYDDIWINMIKNCKIIFMLWELMVYNKLYNIL